jgi:hypothetical protein
MASKPDSPSVRRVTYRRPRRHPLRRARMRSRYSAVGGAAMGPRTGRRAPGRTRRRQHDEEPRKGVCASSSDSRAGRPGKEAQFPFGSSAKHAGIAKDHAVRDARRVERRRVDLFPRRHSCECVRRPVVRWVQNRDRWWRIQNSGRQAGAAHSGSTASDTVGALIIQGVSHSQRSRLLASSTPPRCAPR